MERPNSQIILQRSQPRPALSGQFTVIIEGSPGFLPRWINTTSSLGMPIAEAQEMTMVPLGISSYSGARFVLRRVGEIGGLALVFGWKCSVLICETAVRPYIFFFFQLFLRLKERGCLLSAAWVGPNLIATSTSEKHGKLLATFSKGVMVIVIPEH